MLSDVVPIVIKSRNRAKVNAERNCTGNGDSSFFFGLASTFAPLDVQAEVKDNNGKTYTLESTAPNFSP